MGGLFITIRLKMYPNCKIQLKTQWKQYISPKYPLIVDISLHFLPVCNFIVHEKCVSSVVTPCSGIAPFSIKVSYSVDALVATKK